MKNKIKKPLFILSRKNQKGQVAIFVALIFQIIFVFFALLINVGLLVHHKINLQQSTDLAAYYGAMKQAEMLNVISHVNFQIRQAWKLLTWRYRILGTFGMIPLPVTGLDLPVTGLDLPVTGLDSQIQFNSTDRKCLPENTINLNDVPAFCLAHVGYKDWRGGKEESYCKINCNTLTTGASQSLGQISGAGNLTVAGAAVGAAINAAITAVNKNITDKCREGTVIGASILARYLDAYHRDVKNKNESIKLLLANLSQSKDNFLDLNGQKVFDGVKKTFENNLTEANLASVAGTLNIVNGLSDDFDAAKKCQYQVGSSDSQLVAEVIFKYLAFFQMACANDGKNAFQFVNILDTNLNTVIETQLKNSGMAPEIIKDIFAEHTSVGFEKNPWCISYYGVRASAEPKIPFLPISKIKLSAVSFAKPFGGSIGPAFYTKWESTEDISTRQGNSVSKIKTDKNLPNLDPAGETFDQLSKVKNVIVNYSKYVGDSKGLADVQFIGLYHDLLIGAVKLGGSSNDWPAFSNWNKIAHEVDDPNYNPIAESGAALDQLSIRNLELSVVAPNQFDLTYYSIDSDFYNNYFLKKLDNQTNSAGKNTVTELKNKIPGFDKVIFSPDYGYDKNNSANFTTSDQLKIVEKIMRSPTLKLSANPKPAENTFFFIPKSPASFLTGWTFLNLTNAEGYSIFPNADATPKTSMPFGTCNDFSGADTANKNYESLTTHDSGGTKLPPTPGNCISGGRTGYSVKIVSQEAINGEQGPIGGANTSGKIRNPIPDSFLNF